jgi:adenylate kinase
VILILLGPPGSGKGTQGEILVKRDGFFHLSTGELMRAEIVQGTELGSRIQMLIENGYLVDDETTLQLVQNQLSGLESDRRVVLDGFPRTDLQAKQFDAMLSNLQRKVDRVIELDAPRSDVAARLKLRARNDDTDAAIEQRITDFEQQTRPLLDYYRSHGTRVDHVDGTPDIETVAKEIEKVLNE